MNEEDLLDDNHFPWEHVEAARNDSRLQREHPATDAKERLVGHSKHCPQCNAAPNALHWFYFCSPDKTREMLCGRAGWMTVCDKCRRQVDFFLEVMN
ncbi:MAG TPA: hypothetical protein VN761_13615 [Candidatus Polarisedimenticolia bacterium]|nr:hypothetical protein [Candidatus Polarisedimenticolia bacterium]